MRRIIYAPKVFAFIRSSQQGGKIYDVSDDIVSGQVTRNVNEPSTAEIILRNRYRKWIKDPHNQESIFLPMDMISIWLQKVAGKPIQVFTGYLDSAPMYQMYPGNCRITATCTLKKLALQWFDPGLEFFTSWINNMGNGWIIDPATGEAQNPTLNLSVDPTQKHPINDGGFAQLLHDFLTHIAGWRQENVLISDLPLSIPKRAAALYQDINKNTEADLARLEEVMRQIMGISWSPVNETNFDGTLNSHTENITKILKAKADQYNMNLIVLISAAINLTGYDPKYHHPSDKDGLWGYGLFAARPNAGGTGNAPTTIDGHPFSDLSNPSLAAELFCRRLIQVDTTSQGNPGGGASNFSNSANSGDFKAMRSWIEAASGRKIDATKFATDVQTAIKWTKIWNAEHNTTLNTNIFDPIKQYKNFTWADATKIMDTQEKKIYQNAYQNKTISELAPFFIYLKNNYRQFGVTLDSESGQNRGELWVQIQKYGTVVGAPGASGTNTKAIINDLNRHVPQYIEAVDISGFNRIRIRVKSGAPYPVWAGRKSTNILPTSSPNNNPDPTQSAIAQNGLTFQQLGQFSLDAAFTAQFAFPANYIESHILTGEKALMNDVTCLSAVQQFCQASLRNFMSLPDGKFLAFYPDYFGAYGRGPYMNIYDIEIVNMGIQLNDEALATHVYVVGDTFGLDQKVDMWDEFGSRGVATLGMEALLDSIITPIGDHRFNDPKHKTSWGRLKDAYEFMQHFGARPYKEEQPLIRNSFYEFLYAWQRFAQLWARTFATNVEFTYMPELLPGGIIGFPQHNLQMYVESATHTFDYTAGFTTTAVLSSPAAIKNNGKGVAGIPGFALAGNVNSVGVGE